MIVLKLCLCASQTGILISTHESLTTCKIPSFRRLISLWCPFLNEIDPCFPSTIWCVMLQKKRSTNHKLISNFINIKYSQIKINFLPIAFDRHLQRSISTVLIHLHHRFKDVLATIDDQITFFLFQIGGNSND